eukprot:m.84083 g.84083  ORF g.84083 m.84083 type:complete len:454 (+) comp9580_c0_seq1:3644-5005(+)
MTDTAGEGTEGQARPRHYANTRQSDSDPTHPQRQPRRTWSVRKLTKDEQKELKQDRTLQRDSRWNTVGMASLVTVCFVLGRWPHNFWILHFLFMMVLMPLRYSQFKKHNQELYLLDFCYFGGAYYSALGTGIVLLRVTTGIQTWLTPYNDVLFRVLFGYASGPLALSVYLFRNSLVLFHPGFSTSVWIHTSPAITMWAVRWGAGLGYAAFERAWPGMAKVCPGVDPEVADSCMMELWCDACPARRREFMLYPLCFYVLFWVIPYYLVVFVVIEGWIKRTGKATLFGDYVKADNPGGQLLRSIPESLQPIVYLSLHALHVVLSSGIGWIFWHSFPLHTMFIVVTLLVVINNGSTYIFKVFSLRYYAERVEDVRRKEQDEEDEVRRKSEAAAAAQESVVESKAERRWRYIKVGAICSAYFAVLLSFLRSADYFLDRLGEDDMHVFDDAYSSLTAQ